MRTVLIGTDFVYDKNGNLKPIEINTAVGWDMYKPESNSDSLDTTNIKDFIVSNAFTKLIYIGNVPAISSSFVSASNELNIEFSFVKVNNDSVTIPYVEDADTTLIVRSAYDTTALVDDTYCRDKVNFLELIKNSDFGAQFAYKDSNNTLVNHITSIPDNGDHPNFILKAVLPQYDKDVFPKLYKVTSQEELDIVLQNVTNDYFLMEYYANENELFANHLKVYRYLSILYPPTLQSIPLGGYTRLTETNLSGTNTYDNSTFELSWNDKTKYITSDVNITTPKLANGDLVEMADGSFKTAEDLQVGDIVKTIDIPNPNNLDISEENVNFQINFNEFFTGTTYSTNKILAKRKINKFVKKIKLTFTDNSEWYDTTNSYYLSLRNGEIRFLALNDYQNSNNTNLQVGDTIILLDTSFDEINITTKEISAIESVKEIFDGYTITVERQHLFLTKTDSVNTGNTSFVAIEHNYADCPIVSLSTCVNLCNKGFTCCQFDGTCRPGCAQCPQP